MTIREYVIVAFLLVGTFCGGYSLGRNGKPRLEIVKMKDPIGFKSTSVGSFEVEYAVIVNVDTGEVVKSISNRDKAVSGD